MVVDSRLFYVAMGLRYDCGVFASAIDGLGDVMRWWCGGVDATCGRLLVFSVVFMVGVG